jgi:SAM-dependent methyltransferase
MEEETWDKEVAAGYDTPGSGMFAPEVLAPVVDRLVELAEGGPVLEFAIGTGRVAVPLLERGIAVHGIDSSAAMVAELRKKVDEQSLPVVIGDMSSDRVAGEFSLVYLVFNTISNLLSQKEQVACFKNAARHLRPGGRFVIELFVPGLPAGQKGALIELEPGYLLVDTYDVVAQQLTSHHFYFGEGREARLFRSTHRYVLPGELDLMAEMAGFELESRHGDWVGAPFTEESTSHVSVYRLSHGR